MSKAFMCDRCRTCFNPLDIKRDQYFITIKEVFTQNGCEYLGNEVEYRTPDAMHLCPSCSVLISKIMRMDPDICCSCDKRKEEEIYDEGFEAGLAAVYHVRDILVAAGFDPGVFVPGRESGDFDGDHQVVERKKRAKKDGEH